MAVKKLLTFLGPKRFFCPVCGKKFRKFVPLPDYYRKMAEEHGFAFFGQGEMTAHETYSCPICGASDRERLYAFWIDYQVRRGQLNGARKIIHFAPEAQLSLKLRKYRQFDYETADLCMENVDHTLDMMDMPFADGAFDFFICSHVLEHVDDDALAVRELFRITRSGGTGILMAPIIVGLASTRESPSITSESERWKQFGQNDHVRLYAHNDYVEMIEQQGFRVSQLGIEEFGKEIFDQLGLKDTSVLYIVEKP